jgi:hypothetical protein
MQKMFVLIKKGWFSNHPFEDNREGKGDSLHRFPFLEGGVVPGISEVNILGSRYCKENRYN